MCALVALFFFAGCPNAADKGGEPPAKTYTVSFDQSGGEGGRTAPITVTAGKPMPALNADKPAKTENGAELFFTGYWDAQTGGNQYYNADMRSAKNWDKDEDATLYAQYTEEAVFDRAYYTANTTFNVVTAEQLKQIAALSSDMSFPLEERDFAGKTIMLINSIDFGAGTEPNFIGIANGNWDKVLFSGTFDGNGNTIKNMRIDHSSETEWKCGLFGFTESTAVIKNVKLEGGYVKNMYVNDNFRTAAGGLAGIHRGLIENCTNESLAVNGYIQVGGLVGQNRGTVKDSTNKATVTAEYKNAGGIVGLNWESGSIQKCENSGSILSKSVGTTSSDAGGIAGVNEANCTITESVNTGTVTGLGWGVGGITGKNTHIVQSSTNSGTINGKQATGGIVGGNGDDKGLTGTVEGCTNSGTITGETWGTGGIVGANDNGTVEDCTNTADITGSTTDTGNSIGGIVGKNRGSVKSCDNSGTVTGFQNIGGVTGMNDYNATLKGSVEGGTNSGAVNGFKSVGGITGRNFGFVKLSSNSGKISVIQADGERVGGIVGRNGDTSSTGAMHEGFIDSCYNTGEVSGFSYVGGIAGGNEYGNITKSYNTASLFGTDSHTGGIAGRHNMGAIENCYNTGSIQAGRTSGGIAGIVEQGTIKNCYNTASVNVAQHNSGGIAGFMRNGSISNCYNIGDTGYFGGILGSIDTANANPVTGCYYLQTETINPFPGNNTSSPKGVDGFILSHFGWNPAIWKQSSSAPEVNGVTSRPVLINPEEK